MLVNKNKNLLERFKRGKSYYLFPSGQKVETGLGNTRKN